MPKISVIVPIYKVEKYLRECVDSILAQTFKDFELILVDDGSPDGCGAICDEYRSRDERVVVIHKQNGGVSSARNAGIEAARGEWIAFVDGDDWWLKNHLENIKDAIQKVVDADVVFTGFTTSNIRNFNPVISQKLLVIDDYYKMRLRGCAMWTSCVCFHSRIRAEMPMFRIDLTHGEDLDLWDRFSKNYKLVFISSVTAVYRLGVAESACRKIVDPRKTIIWDKDLENIKNLYEQQFFYNIYFGFLSSYFPRHMDLFFKMWRRKRGISLFMFFFKFIKQQFERVVRSLKKLKIR